MIITDGIITDMVQTKEAIVQVKLTETYNHVCSLVGKNGLPPVEDDSENSMGVMVKSIGNPDGLTYQKLISYKKWG